MLENIIFDFEIMCIVLLLHVYSLLFLLIVFIVDYFQVFVNHFDDLVEVVTFPLSLAQGLRRAKLVPQQAVDSILNSKEPQDLINTRLLVSKRSGTCSKSQKSNRESSRGCILPFECKIFIQA